MTPSTSEKFKKNETIYVKFVTDVWKSYDSRIYINSEVLGIYTKRLSK
jgi:hypothetical protein